MTIASWKQMAVDLMNKGVSWRQIAKRLDVPRSTVSDYLRTVKQSLGARVLVLDIETAPASAYHWRRWKENIGKKQVISEGYIITWAAKWLGSEDVMFAKLPDFEDTFANSQADDSALVGQLHALLEEADFVIAHNGRKFDLPTINARLLVNGYNPPHPYKIIDTLDIAKKAFKFPSNSLASLAIYLGVELRKLDTGGFDLWTDVIANKPQAWADMMEYNIYDVLVLEQVYMKLRPWYTTHPAMQLLNSSDILRCTCCGSHNVVPTGKFFYTNVSKFDTYACGDCGKMNRGRVNKLDKAQRLVGV